MNFPSGWYVIGTLREMSKQRLNPLCRFGIDWIVRKTKKGKWIAQVDACPHRSARLSLGKLENDCLSCPFHGFQFDDHGTCIWVPEIERGAPGLKLETIELTVLAGFLWFPWKEPTGAIPWFEELSEEFSYSWSKHQWKKHFTRCVENQLDYAHLPFVHRTSIGRGFNPAIHPRYEFSEKALKVDIGQHRENQAYFEFRFGNIWKLNISNSMKQVLAFVPVDENETLIYLRTYHRFTQIPLIRLIVAWVLAPFNYLVLAQDHSVVMSQSPNDSVEAINEVLFPSDRAIRAFRNWMTLGSAQVTNEKSHANPESQ